MREPLKYVYVGCQKLKYNIAQNQSISELDFPKYHRFPSCYDKIIHRD